MTSGRDDSIEAADAAGQCPVTGAPASRLVDVGWLLDTAKSQFIWAAPTRVERGDPPPQHAKSASKCPALLDYEARLYSVPCPIDARIGFRRDAEGKPQLFNADGDQASIRGKYLGQMLSLVAEREWRQPGRPIVQIVTPYVFLADEPVYMSQMPPFAQYRARPWPGILLGGRLPIHIWPRQMMWAFEWWDPAQPIELTRGEPWFYVRFEAHDPTRRFRLFEAEMTQPLREYIAGLTAVSNYVDQTFALFKTAQERRPARLLVRKVY